jgi:hypothetical protein
LRHSIGRDHTEPFLTPLKGVDVKDIGRDKTWRDAIYTGKINPLNSETFGKLNNASLGSVILSKMSVAYPY